jgi:hypothetical protein
MSAAFKGRASRFGALIPGNPSELRALFLRTFGPVEVSMTTRNRVASLPFVAATAAVLTLALPVEAQMPKQNQVEKGQDSVNLTMEQRHIIKEIILKDMKTAPQAANAPMTVGSTVPAGIPLQPIPVEVSAKIPQLKSHSFLVKDEKVIIIDPKDNKVAALVE